MGSLFCCNKHCRLYFSRSLALRSIKSAPPSMSRSAARMYSVIGKKRCTAPSGSLTRASRKACRITSDMPAIHAIESRKKRCVRLVIPPDRTRFAGLFCFFISLLLSSRWGVLPPTDTRKHDKKNAFPRFLSHVLRITIQTAKNVYYADVYVLFRPFSLLLYHICVTNSSGNICQRRQRHRLYADSRGAVVT